MLLDMFERPCVLMEKKRVPDGAGGWLPTQWTEGAEFNNYMSVNTSMEARVAEKQGVTSVYTALVKESVPVEYGDVFRDKTTGITYRITSEPSEKKAPRSASFALKYFTAEKYALPE